MFVLFHVDKENILQPIMYIYKKMTTPNWNAKERKQPKKD